MNPLPTMVAVSVARGLPPTMPFTNASGLQSPNLGQVQDYLDAFCGWQRCILSYRSRNNLLAASLQPHSAPPSPRVRPASRAALPLLENGRLFTGHDSPLHARRALRQCRSGQPYRQQSEQQYPHHPLRAPPSSMSTAVPFHSDFSLGHTPPPLRLEIIPRSSRPIPLAGVAYRCKLPTPT